MVGVGWWYGDHECLDLDTPFVHPEPAYLTGGIYLGFLTGVDFRIVGEIVWG